MCPGPAAAPAAHRVVSQMAICELAVWAAVCIVIALNGPCWGSEMCGRATGTPTAPPRVLK